MCLGSNLPSVCDALFPSLEFGIAHRPSSIIHHISYSRDLFTLHHDVKAPINHNSSATNWQPSILNWQSPPTCKSPAFIIVSEEPIAWYCDATTRTIAGQTYFIRDMSGTVAFLEHVILSEQMWTLTTACNQFRQPSLPETRVAWSKRMLEKLFAIFQHDSYSSRCL